MYSTSSLSSQVALEGSCPREDLLPQEGSHGARLPGTCREHTTALAFLTLFIPPHLQAQHQPKEEQTQARWHPLTGPTQDETEGYSNSAVNNTLRKHYTQKGRPVSEKSGKKIYKCFPFPLVAQKREPTGLHRTPRTSQGEAKHAHTHTCRGLHSLSGPNIKPQCMQNAYNLMYTDPCVL